jgi:hypothetical protein
LALKIKRPKIKIGRLKRVQIFQVPVSMRSTKPHLTTLMREALISSSRQEKEESLLSKLPRIRHLCLLQINMISKTIRRKKYGEELQLRDNEIKIIMRPLSIIYFNRFNLLNYYTLS